MSKHYVHGDRESSRSYSRSIVVSGGRTAYLAGVGAPFDEAGNSLAGNFSAQSHGCFAALERTLSEIGGTLSDVVAMTVFVTDLRHGDEFVGIRRSYFPDGNFPTSALIGIEALAKPEMMVEIQATAVLAD